MRTVRLDLNVYNSPVAVEAEVSLYNDRMDPPWQRADEWGPMELDNVDLGEVITFFEVCVETALRAVGVQLALPFA